MLERFAITKPTPYICTELKGKEKNEKVRHPLKN